MECPDNLISHQVGGQKINVFFYSRDVYFKLNKRLEDPNKLINFTYFMVSF